MAGTGKTPTPADWRARRRATVATTKLPAGGRTGRTPKWPLGEDVRLSTTIEVLRAAIATDREDAESAPSARERHAAHRRVERSSSKLAELEAMRTTAAKLERDIWRQLWRTPQAVQWERRGYFREVALYVRHQAKAEAGSLDDSKEARQREDRLGLSDMAMARLRWEIEQPAAAAATKPPDARGGSRYRDLRVVE